MVARVASTTMPRSIIRRVGDLGCRGDASQTITFLGLRYRPDRETVSIAMINPRRDSRTTREGYHRRIYARITRSEYLITNAEWRLCAVGKFRYESNPASALSLRTCVSSSAAYTRNVRSRIVICDRYSVESSAKKKFVRSTSRLIALRNWKAHFHTISNLSLLKMEIAWLINNISATVHINVIFFFKYKFETI